MVIVLIALALLVVGLLLALVLMRGSATEFRLQAEAREEALIAERAGLREKQAELERGLTSRRNEVERLNTEGARQAGEIRRQASQLSERAAAAAQMKADLEERIEAQSGEISALVADMNGLQKRVEEADAALVEAEKARLAAEEEIAAAESRNAGLVIGELAEVDGAHPEALWDLEVARSERTWRNSVAVDPTSPEGPFVDAADPVRLAVEIEAAALRENVGAFISIDWQAEPVNDPAQRHLVVRVAQEMLEAAARNPEPLRLVATGESDVTLRLELAEPDPDSPSDQVTIPSPMVASDLIDIREDVGLSVTVKAE